VPHGAAHVLSDSPALPPVPLDHVLGDCKFDGTGPLVFGGGGRPTVIVCGYFAFDQEVMHPVISSLPALMHLQGRAGCHFAWLEQLLASMEAETRARAEAWQEITTRMAEILFVYTLREYMGKHPNSTGALMALSDHRVARALRAVHADPAVDWSIDALAVRASLSKTAFGEAFRRMLGVTPMQYIIRGACTRRVPCSIGRSVAFSRLRSRLAMNRSRRLIARSRSNSARRRGASVALG
jgi:AraC-like DNA-binding protein